MQGIILAAGLGTRLAPYTHQVPKALFKVGNKTLLDWVLQKMIKSGISPIVVNLYYFSSMVRQHLMYHYPDVEIHFSDEGLNILGTGGGIARAARYLIHDDVLVHNVDVLSGINLTALEKAWQEANCDVMLVVKERHASRELLFEPKTLRWSGWRNQKNELKVIDCSVPVAYGFCGISIFRKGILHQINSGKNYSFINLLERLHRKNYMIRAYVTNEWWIDAGTLDNISTVNLLVKNFHHEFSK